MLGDSVAFMTDIYTNHYSSIAAHLTPFERASLHVIYDYFKAIDNALSECGRIIAENLDSPKLNDILGIQSSRMHDIRDLIDARPNWFHSS